MKISILDAAKIAYEVKRALNPNKDTVIVEGDQVVIDPTLVPFEETTTEIRESAINSIHQYLQTAGESTLDAVTKAVVDASR